VLGSERLTAAQFRERATRALAQERYAAAVVDAVRAIAQGAAERALLDDAPSVTAHEIALRLLEPFPARGDDLRAAADLFDVVAYGTLAPSRAQAERVVALEAELARTRPARRPPREPGARAGAAGGAAPDGAAR
jgi:hypothetical protein